MRTWILLIILLTLGRGEAHATMQLTRQGRALCPILLRKDAITAERYAASEFAQTLKQISGADFEVRDAEGTAPERAILIGASPMAKALFPEVAFDAFAPEECAYRTKGGVLLLAGGRPRGVLYAVYRFLQEQCGVRWWAPWATRLPKKATLTLPELNVTQKPAFESRDPYWFPAFDGAWAARNGSNGVNARLTEAMGGKIVYEGFVHTFFPLIPPEKHFAEHPEWYSLINGKRTHQNAQLCTTNPHLREVLLAQVKQRLRENPQANILSVSQNDWYGACQCPDCKALDDREGSHAGTMLALANYIAEGVKTEFPNVAIDTLAYQYTRKAPKTVTPLPNVIVRLCSIECNFAQPLEHPSNNAFAQDIRDWSEKSQRLYVWDYTTNFAHYVLPHPNWFSLGANVRFFHQHGVRGLFEQGAYQSHGSEMAELRAWVLAQLLWNPYQDDRKLIREFLEGYYGKAARPIARYLTLMQKAAERYYMTCFTNLNAPYLRYETLSKAEALWQEAERAVQDDPGRLWRVRQGHLPVRYAFLARWVPLRRECLIAGGTWTLPISRKAVAEEWLRTATGTGPEGWKPMTHINEGGVTPQKFVEGFAIDPPEPIAPPANRSGTPAPPPGITLGRRQGVDIPAEKMGIIREGDWAEFCVDDAASRRFAVRMPGRHNEWACQVPLKEAPERARSGKWEVYVVARVETSSDASAETTAFTTGVYDAGAGAGAATLAVKVGQAAKAYQTYRIGTVDLNAQQYFWIAPPGNSAVRALYVDRFYLVPLR